jgi:hypothetical protein
MPASSRYGQLRLDQADHIYDSVNARRNRIIILCNQADIVSPWHSGRGSPSAIAILPLELDTAVDRSRRVSSRRYPHLSRLKQGFDSPRERQQFQPLRIICMKSSNNRQISVGEHLRTLPLSSCSAAASSCLHRRLKKGGSLLTDRQQDSVQTRCPWTRLNRGEQEPLLTIAVLGVFSIIPSLNYC